MPNYSKKQHFYQADTIYPKLFSYSKLISILESILYTLKGICNMRHDDNFDGAPTRIYENLGLSPKKVATNFSNDIQGICHDENQWYVSHGAGSLEYENIIGGRNFGAIHAVPVGYLGKEIKCTEEKQPEGCMVYSNGVLENHRFYKYYDTITKSPIGIKVGEIHFGDIDYYKGYIFVPVYQNGKEGDVDAQILVFSTKTFDCVWQEVLSKNNGHFQKHAWCAVNPLDGCLYTSDGHVSSSFDEGSSPVLAYKINFENLEKKRYPVFTCVNKKGIDLRRCTNYRTNPNTEPYSLDAGMQGGCFDNFDTLYLSSGFGSHQKNDGITAFMLLRDNENSMNEFIQKRAYYIWQEKGCPWQTEEEKRKDWLNATWQICSAFQSGLLKFDGAAVTGLACTKEYSADSAIDFSFDGDAKVYPEEPEGLTYWDLRKYVKKDKVNEDWLNGTLHAIKLHNNDDSLLTGNDTYSMQNYVIRKLESPLENITYNPARLTIEYNPISKRWTVLSEEFNPIKEFETKQEAENALLVMRQFKSMKRIGRCSSNEANHDFSYDFLQERVQNSVNTKNVQKESVHFDDLRIDDKTNVATYIWESDYAVLMQLSHFNKFGETYQSLSLPINNNADGTLIGLIYTLIRKEDNYINCIKSSSRRIKDNLYWFE